jgi:triosephosphate isomerase (TIM)
MARKPFIAGNWKMNNDRRQSRALLHGLLDAVGHLDQVDVGVAPPYTALQTAGEVLWDNRILLCAQNVHFAASGAFTGEISASMLREIGVDQVIVGHSERRHVFGETDEVINQKVHAVLDAGLGVILCVGEQLEDRKAGRTLAVVSRQVRAGLEGVDAGAAAMHLTVAYEPVWAIGTGLTATPEQAQEVHADIRALLAQVLDSAAAEAIRIQYGGSVKPGNAAELLAQPDIDGALVGGASLKAGSFVEIVRAALPGT